jgi:hypothetical protein
MALILNSTKQKIFEAINQVGLNPKDFIPDREMIDQQLHLKYRNTELYFLFRMKPTSFEHFNYSYNQFSPKFDKVIAGEQNRWYGLNDTLKAFKEWLELHVRKYEIEMAISDPWEDLVNEEFFSEQTEDEKFTSGETEHIIKGLEQFKLQAAEKLALPEPSLDRLNKKIDELQDDIKKMSKGKWLQLFYGFVIKEIYGVITDEQKRQVAVSLLKNALISVQKYVNLLTPPHL